MSCRWLVVSSVQHRHLFNTSGSLQGLRPYLNILLGLPSAIFSLYNFLLFSSIVTARHLLSCCGGTLFLRHRAIWKIRAIVLIGQFSGLRHDFDIPSASGSLCRHLPRRWNQTCMIVALSEFTIMGLSNFEFFYPIDQTINLGPSFCKFLQCLIIVFPSPTACWIKLLYVACFLKNLMDQFYCSACGIRICFAVGCLCRVRQFGLILIVYYGINEASGMDLSLP